MIKRIIENIIGLLFIFSAVTKLYDFSNTVYLFISIFGLSFHFIKYGLVILSIIEIAIGVSFFINTWATPKTFFAIIILLSSFVFLNGYFHFFGFTNCGCFGTQIISSPISSLIKNIIIILFLTYDYKTKRIPVLKTL